MDPRKIAVRETLIVSAGVAVCTAVMFGVFALLGKFDRTVLLGGAVGTVLTAANFFFMSVGAMVAADKAEDQNVAGGKATVKVSYLVRMAVLAVLLFAFAKSGLCNVVALVLPLAFVRPTIMISEFFRKAGEKNR